MSLVYGTVPQTPTRYYEFASQTKQNIRNSKTSMPTGVSFVRILITIGEIAATFIPGVGPLAQTAIGLVGAGINTALSAEDGTLSAFSVGLDFTAGLIPGITGIRYANKVRRGYATARTLAAEKTILRGIGDAAEEKAFKIFHKESRIASKKLASAQKLQGEAIRKSKNLLKRWARGTFTNEEKLILKYEKYLGEEAKGALNIAKNEARLARGLDEFKVSMKDVQKTLREYREIFEHIKGLKTAKISSKARLIKEIEKAAPGMRAELLKEIYVPGYISKKSAIGTLNLEAKIKIINVMKNMSAESRKIMTSAIKFIFARRLEVRQIEKFMSKIFEVIEKTHPEDMVHVNLLVKKDFLNSTFNAFGVLGRGFETTARRRIIKKLGSRWFNDRIVQRLQLIDPNDFGRMFPEKAYQYLKDKLKDNLLKRATRGGLRKAAILLKEAEDVEAAFEKSGGTLMEGSRHYIIGIKVLHSSFNNHICYVKFNKLNTAAKHAVWRGQQTKNHGGKKDILIQVTSWELHRLLGIGGMKYWWDVGRKKGWFVSRGGSRKDLGDSLSAVSNELSLFLGFVPIPALRNVLSITSNWVENIADMSRGNYFKEWIPKFERAIIRTSINRSFRLLTRYVIPGYARLGAKARSFKNIQVSAIDKGLKKGSKAWKDFVTASLKTSYKKIDKAWEIIGRESQRLSTTVLSTFEGKDKNGYFKFVPSSGEKLAKKILFAAAPTAVRGALLRKGKHDKSYAKGLIGARRNLGQMGRVWSAVTPTGTVKPLRTLTRIR